MLSGTSTEAQDSPLLGFLAGSMSPDIIIFIFLDPSPNLSPIPRPAGDSLAGSCPAFLWRRPFARRNTAACSPKVYPHPASMRWGRGEWMGFPSTWSLLSLKSAFANLASSMPHQYHLLGPWGFNPRPKAAEAASTGRYRLAPFPGSSSPPLLLEDGKWPLNQKRLGFLQLLSFIMDTQMRPGWACPPWRWLWTGLCFLYSIQPPHDTFPQLQLTSSEPDALWSLQTRLVAALHTQMTSLNVFSPIPPSSTLSKTSVLTSSLWTGKITSASQRSFYFPQ